MARQLAREIIFAIGDNMREGLEPLLTKTLAPSLYQIYLHSEDYDRLRTIFSQIEEEARTFLDQQLEELNRQSVPVSQKVRDRLPERLRGKQESPEATVQHVPAEGAWHFRFQEDPNDALEPGEIEVVSELAVGDVPDYGGGSATQKIAVSTTRRLGQSASRRAESTGPLPVKESEEGSLPVDPAARTLAAKNLMPPALVGVLRYADEDGEHRFEIEKDEITVGRGAVDVWVDVRLHTKADVSRQHLRIGREGGDAVAGGRYWIEDLSQFGTELNGEPLQREQRQELPVNSVIELASVLRIDFRVEPAELD